MLKTASQGQRAEGKKAKFDVEIASVATAVPAHKIGQAEIAKRAREIFPHLPRLESLYGNTGIDNRYLCEPPDWYHERHGWETRTAIFQRHALALLEEVALKTTEAASIKLDDIGALIVNTITGLAIPSLDAKLMNRLRLPRSVERLPIFGLGCGGGVGGSPAPLATRKPCRSARMSCFSPSTSARSACASPIRVWQCLWPLPCLAMGRREWFCATLTEQVAAQGGAQCSPLAIISGQTPSKSWDGTSRRMGSGWC